MKHVGRYTIFNQIGAGGMATVHLARFSGPEGFSRVVAVKHLLPHLSLDAEFKSLIVQEARTASRVRHPNVVPTLDVVADEGEVYIVMEYVPGEALSFLRRAAKDARQDIPAAICSAILVGALQGLHAAHEARSPAGELLDIVHRDVSPPNILVGSDGVPVVLDFGIAKSLQGQAEPRSGRVKGKSSYMAPEQIRGEPLTRAVDIFAAAIVLWELLTGRRLFYGATEQERMRKVLEGAEAMPPSLLCPLLPKGLDDVVLRGLRQNPRHRYQTALEMAEAIERVVPPASQRAVAKWVAQTASDSLRRRAELLKEVESFDLAIPAATDREGRHVNASQASYAPIAVGPRPPAQSRRSRRSIAEGVAMAMVAAAILIMVAGSGRLGADVLAPLQPATVAAAHGGTAPLVVPTSATPRVRDLFPDVASPVEVARPPLERPGPVVALPMATPSVAPASSTLPVRPSPERSAPPYLVVANAVVTAPEPRRDSKRAAPRGAKAPARKPPPKATKRHPRTTATAMAASGAPLPPSPTLSPPPAPGELLITSD